MMNSKIKMCLVLGGVLVLSSAAVQAQRHGPDGPPPFGGPMELMGFEGMHGGKVVKGAPFSATATSETTETLQDGSVIHRTSQVSMYRDSQGRSRNEATFTGFGPLTASGTPKKMVMISDPVAGVHIMLDDEQKVAHKSTIRTRTGNGSDTDSAATFQSREQERIQKEEAAGLLKKESLGTQTINGVIAEGTRTTRIIPVGQIGNEKALQIVSERWYSADLQIVLKSTRTDPRNGTTTYTVTSVQRTEPSASLFAVPAGYSVQAGGRGPGGSGGRGPAGGPPTVD
ncbi:MAG TPA: hypothetical protein VJW94_05060 [Candidatus Acidoferrum sp.]|nr:hypothetical protein [Candidatus Acidoferrum sp.]